MGNTDLNTKQDRTDTTLLAIETATPRLSAALALPSGAIIERHEDSRISHCELLSSFIIDLTAEAAIPMDAITAVAVSNGPGSFTGLRIGLATAMGLAFGLSIDVIQVPTLQSLVVNIGKKGDLVCPVMDAKRSEAYAALYRITDGLPETVIEPAAFPLEKLADILSGTGGTIIITGPAAEQFSPALSTLSSGSGTLINTVASQPSAVAIACLGQLIHRRGGGINPAAVSPVYLRRSDAEILRDQHCSS